jgi:serine/threonine-protein kinase RsbW
MAFRDVHLEIRSTLESLDLVQTVTEDIAREFGFDEDAVHWMSVAVRESVVNAITHGNQRDPDKLVFIDYTADRATEPQELVVRVRDQGHGFDPDEIGDPLAPENVLKSGGRGIFLIRQFMDDVALERAGEGGMEVRMRKRMRQQEQQQKQRQKRKQKHKPKGKRKPRKIRIT